MLEYLHVKNLALMEECELDFSGGLNVLTGETGAGKSILLGSVNLALGAHADREMIRTGCDEAYVELGFSINSSVRSLLEKAEISCEDDTVYISRKITSTKNVFKINGETVPGKQVKELAGLLLDIHGQHEHQSLLSNARQLEMLDAFGGDKTGDALAEVTKTAAEYKRIKNELDEALSRNKDRSRELSLLRYEVEEIANANLVIGEDEELEERYKRMQASEKLLSLTTEALALVSGDSGADAGSFISKAIQNMRRVSAIDESASGMEEMLLEAESILGDFSLELSQYMEGCEFSEEEFSRVEERLNTINSLKARFGSTIDKVLKYLEEKSAELDKLENFEEYLKGLEADERKAKKAYDDAALILTNRRIECGEEFSKLLVSELSALNFDNVKFNVALETKPDAVSSKGKDSIEFMISTNLGEPVRPMKNVASGGELSRIMLAIKTILAGKDDIDALIFDEIDTGISGRTAWEVAGKLSKLSTGHQVILITHLAQIAAMGDVHYRIEKKNNGEKTFTVINKLDSEGEISELARLLGSDVADEASLTNARELKGKANARKEEVM